MQDVCTFDGALVYHPLKETLLVNIAPIDPLLNGALVDQPIHICLTLLGISEYPSNSLHLCMQHMFACCVTAGKGAANSWMIRLMSCKHYRHRHHDPCSNAFSDTM